MGTKNIIVIDDDVAILDSLGLMLNFEGFNVSAFERGSEIFKCVENQCKPDIILLDMWLSVEDGREICRKLKNYDSTKNIPVVIISASRGLEKTAMQSGADAFIAKPFEFEDVINKLNKLIA